jgi:TfoX/Sxy family transcriptional regulator of competence genes
MDVDRFGTVVAALAHEGDVTTSRMFGSDGLKANGKVFAMNVKGRLVVKLVPDRVQELLASGMAAPFDPGHGRVMREWVAVPNRADVDWLELSREALLTVRRKAG